MIVVDGREQLEVELAAAGAELRWHVESGIATLLKERHFMEALAGYFVGEDNVDRRVRELLRRLRAITAGPTE